MGFSNTLAWFISVFLIAECFSRVHHGPHHHRGGSSVSQQLLSTQFQAAVPQFQAAVSQFQAAVPKFQAAVPQFQVTIPQIKETPLTDPVPPQAVIVYCRAEAIELVINPDLLAGGLPVFAEELWLGPEASPTCGVVSTGPGPLTIRASLQDCGTQLSVNADSLLYSNVVVYSPLPSPDGVIYTNGAAIPVQCQYRRRYSVDSAAVRPAWVPFDASVSATDYLDFSLRLMTDDWQFERGSNVFFLGDEIHLQAAVRLAYHLPLLVFIDWCVATPTPDVDASEVKYSFIKHHGCLADSRSPNSNSMFMRRTEGNHLNLQLDAFRFHKFTGNLVYIHCHMKAIPAAYSVSAKNRACSFIDQRWRSVDGNDDVCNTCEPSKPVGSEPEQLFHIALTSPVQQPNLAPKPGPAGFFNVRPGQSVEPFNALIQSKSPAFGGLSKRGTDSNKEWMKFATVGPLLLKSKQETSVQSAGGPRFGLDNVFAASFVEKPVFNFTEMRPVEDELEPAPRFRSFSPLQKSIFNVSDLFNSEGSGFE
ncbi:zona pellucida sperm-binding protein 3b precursor [Danio rerio]|uniref:Zona pellucida sperm-binding protein 3 n=1 Tax=Danio rerio TaxID=7955 RepID=O12989_DANRE|nr:zona pellucida sperm-binding protein 3b precursor [Danio rerio]AAC36365.2 chorion proteic component [Danio rerio]|eukprot:NP_571771.1 zona pellucida glycoprotein 3b precursor [Danio rerio]